MSETATDHERRQGEGPSFHAVRTFHPTIRVPDVREAERFYERVFGITSIPSELPDYSSCMSIRDVFFETIVPQLFIVDGVQRLATVKTPQINGFGWYVDDVQAVFEQCRSRGIQVVNQYEDPIVGDELPAVGRYRLFFTARYATGMRYTLFPEMELALDPRTLEGWVLPPVSDEDPLGIVVSSHHTILTSDPDRALKFVVDVLGGTVIHEGRDELIGASSIYVHLADAVIEYAVPDSGTAAHDRWASGIPNDTYYAITWHVKDLKQAEAHLQAQGVAIQARSDDAFITDPSTSLVPWGFSASLVPGDPRHTDA